MNNNSRESHYGCIAAHILGKMEISDENCTKVLISYLKNKDNYNRELTVRALIGVGTEECIPYLRIVQVNDKYLQNNIPEIIKHIQSRIEIENKINK